jgi:hypothetical protein
VLVAGGFGSGGDTPNAEAFEPMSGGWVGSPAMPFPLAYQTATLLTDGRVLVVGGYSSTNGTQPSAQLYDPGLGFNAAWRPKIVTASPSVALGGSLTLSGSGFRGISSGSGGNFSQDSPTDYPVVQLRGIESQRMTMLSATNWSTNSFVSAPIGGVLPGWTLATVFVNGIPSTSSIVYIGFPIAPINIVGVRSPVDGSFTLFMTNTPWAAFTVLAATDPSESLSNWAVLGTPIEILPGQFRFIDLQAANVPQRFYRIRSP